MKPELINKDRTWREVICLNPTHSTVQFPSNDIGRINCPICTNAMVTVVKSILTVEHISINDMIED